MSGVLLAGGTNNILFWGVYIVFFGALIYFMAYRPQQKQKKQQEELFASIAIGDSVLTTAGFYGVIIDMTDDTVIDAEVCDCPGGEAGRKLTRDKKSVGTVPTLFCYLRDQDRVRVQSGGNRVEEAKTMKRSASADISSGDKSVSFSTQRRIIPIAPSMT